jgi:hypothetical protein
MIADGAFGIGDAMGVVENHGSLNSKTEYRNPKQIRIPKFETGAESVDFRNMADSKKARMSATR